MQIVRRIQTVIVAAPGVERATEGIITAREESLAGGVVGIVSIGVGSLDAALITQIVVLFIKSVGSEGIACGKSLRLGKWRPLAFLAWSAVVAQVVDIGKEGNTRLSIISHRKCPPEEGRGFCLLFETLLTTKTHSYTTFCIRQPCGIIVVLQPHVHHHFLLSRLLPDSALHIVWRTFIAADILHHIGRHVIQEQFAVAVEEVLSVKQECIDFAPVHGNLSAIVQLHTRQFLDESVKHRPLGHRESIGVIHQCIAVHIELQLSGLHNQLVHNCGGVRPLQTSP